MLQTIVKLGWRRLAQAALGLGMATALVACGGGGGSAGDTVFPGGGTGTGGTTGPTAADLVLTLSGSTLPTDGTGSTLVTVYAVDAKRNTIADVPVAISVDANALVSTSASKTDSTGVVTGSVRIGADQSKRTITVTAVSGSITKTAQITVVTPSPTGTTNGPALTVGLSTTQITPAVGATVTIQLNSATGVALSDVVVSLSTGRGNLADLSVSTVRTDAGGKATAVLKASTSGVTGADYVTAFATIGAVTVSAQQAFTVTNALPTLTVDKPTVTLRLSQPPQTVTATLRDAAGLPVSSQLLQFSPSSIIDLTATPDTGSTDGNGNVSSTVKLGSFAGATSVSDTLRVTGSYANQFLSSTVIVQIVGESPTATMTLSNSNINASAASTASVLVRDVAGNPASGQLVQFSSQFGLVKFDASTALTDATGVAKVTVTPSSSQANGADIVKASVTLSNIAATDSKPVQVVSATSPGTPVLQLGLSTTSVSSAVPATATATLTDSRGQPVTGQVVTFAVVRGLGHTNVATALTNASGIAVALLSPASSASAGADEITASVSYAGNSLSATQGFQVQATNATIQSFTGPATLSAYGQTTLSVTLTGAAVDSPVKLSISSSCAAAGKATVSPASVSATSNSFTLQYRDNGCGAVQPSDLLQLVIDGTSTAKQLTLPIAAPAAVSLAFISSAPEQIFLKGSGFTESSIVTFEVRDAAGNPLPNRLVELRLQTGAGGVTMEGRAVESVDPPSANPFTQTSNALGRVSVRVNSGTQPTPVRVHAKLSGDTIATVSSNLSVGIGLPSQLNFSLSQKTKNIEGYDIDGTTNTYTIIAADRSGNPVPAGTSINFVTEGGQIESIKQIQPANGISTTTANFVSAEPRPADGRVTIVTYALGEESFIDKNGNNIYDAGEDFQDLGNIFKDRNFDGIYDAAFDEYIGLSVNNGSACASTGASAALLALDASIPSMPNTCDGKWSGAGQVYVRRATETVLSTSAARPLWPLGTTNVSFAQSPIVLQVSPNPSDTLSFTPAGGDVICTTAKSSSFLLIAADANPGKSSPFVNKRLNPMAAGTVIASTTPTTGFSTQVVGGSPIPSTTSATLAAIGYTFDTATSGTVFVTFTSPSGTGTSVGFTVNLKVSCP
jgi:5-hydroxyisourate hydrolase-like protein (transthyretin family)